MARSLSFRSLLLVLSVVAACGLALPAAAAATKVEMLWNPGPEYRAGLTLANASPSEPNACATWGSDMSEGDLVGNATDPTRFTSFPCLPSAVSGSPSAAAPSFYVDTRSDAYGNGWTLSDLNKYPGWSDWWESGGSGTPIQFLRQSS